MNALVYFFKCDNLATKKICKNKFRKNHQLIYGLPFRNIINIYELIRNVFCSASSKFRERLGRKTSLR